ncbi:MAG: DNA polymerase IV [Dehalococcoidia bacterium]|nr:DNA polymerase IV [Dehalococcoidia bacterium]
MTNSSIQRHVLHADLDAFYASVEQMDNAALRGKPVIVGGHPENHGVVAAASYEARNFGIKSAMPTRTALRLCPDVNLIKPRFDRYRAVSKQVMDIFLDLTPKIEPLSLDEAYLDITQIIDEHHSAVYYANFIKRQINQKVGLVVSIGVGSNKCIAKIASDLDKPDGLVIVEQGREKEFLTDLNIRKLPGIGPKSVENLNSQKIYTIGQLADNPLGWFLKQFGKRGIDIWRKCNGNDTDPVQEEKEPKSVSVENTYSPDLRDPDKIYEQICELATRISNRLSQKSLRGKTVGVKIRLSDYTTFTRQSTLPNATNDRLTLVDTAWKIIYPEINPARQFRLLGISVSKFQYEEQLKLPIF